MQIAETQTTDDFPEGAILIREDMPNGEKPRLTKVTDRTGTAVLWERDETEVPEVIVPDLPLEALPEYPKVACEVCGLVAGNKGALTGHVRAKHPEPALDNLRPAPLERLDGKTLPRPVIQALENLLSNATFQSVRKVGDRPMEDFWYGFASGMQAALAVVCGTLGYNTDFLNEKNTEIDTKP